MTTAITKPSDLAAIERVLVAGDLSALTEPQRLTYYQRVCESVGLNPLTQPFEYLKLNGKLILYARRACTDQLRQLHKVSITIASRENIGGCYVVTARATTPNGRTDESIGAVPIENLRGENLANAVMKAETKAKRRVTLAICGLSMLDEAELEGVPQARPVSMPESFPLARMETPMPRLPTPPEPEPAESNVVPIREPQTELDSDEKRTVFELFASKLRTRRTAEELIAWLRMFMTTEYPPEVREELKTLYRRHARAMRLDPNELVRKAQKRGDQ